MILSPERAERFVNKFNLEVAYCEYVEAYHSNCSMLKHASDETPIELVVPTSGILAQYNGGRGGLHHIAFEVEDIESVRQEYESKGLYFLEKKAIKGSGNVIVNFLRPRFGEGILVEFVQRI